MCVGVYSGVFVMYLPVDVGWDVFGCVCVHACLNCVCVYVCVCLCESVCLCTCIEIDFISIWDLGRADVLHEPVREFGVTWCSVQGVDKT